MFFPFYKQLDSRDCGPSCLRMVCKYYGKKVSTDFIKDKCFIDKNGVSLLTLSNVADEIGFKTIAKSVKVCEFLDGFKKPCIVHWNSNHFVVVYDIKLKSSEYIIFVADPAIGLVKYNLREFLYNWGKLGDNKDCGIVLYLEKNDSFSTKSEIRVCHYRLKDILKYLAPYKKHLLIILITMLLSSIVGLSFPYIMEGIVDKGISKQRLDLVVLLLISQTLLVIGQMVSNIIKSILSLHVTTKVGVSLISSFINKLMNLPISFFDAKRTGDIIQRIEDHSRIQSFLTGTLLSLLVAVTAFAIYFVVIIKYSLNILIVFIVCSTIYICWILFFMSKRKKIDYFRFQQATSNKNCLLQMIGGMQDIKLNNCEQLKRNEWEQIQQKLYKISLKSLHISQIQEVGAIFINQCKDVVVSYLSAKAVINGDITMGMMMSLQYVIGQLNVPLQQFIFFSRSIQDASLSLERMGEIYNIKDENSNKIYNSTEVPCGKDIIFKNVTFKYGGINSYSVLDNVSFTIQANKTTAIVGASGSGKTTLLKMMLGFYKPIKGSVLLGDKDLSEYSDSEWRKKCGVVLQDGYIFSDSISRNIAMKDKFYLKSIKKAAKMANIDTWISSLPLKYDTPIGIDGQGLSNGQKQRVLIARAICKNADYIFLDEATNSLDANNELEIITNLQGVIENKTVVVVAHRLSTIKNADNIIVLHNGKLIEEGSHDFLVKLKGYYYRLVKNQLDLDA